MPLLLTALTESPGIPGAGGATYPATRLACAQAWADAAAAWASGIVPVSTAVSAAKAPLAAALDAAFGAPDPASTISGIESAFAAFAASVGGGMAGYAPTPPPGPVGFAVLLTSPSATRQEGVAKVAAALTAWMSTGVGALVAPPNTAVPWS